jgi:glycosyltransferase involved in cell wall biosynthesis
MKRILHIVLNPVINDSRVLKEAESLGRHGYKVAILGVQNESGDLPEQEELSFFKICRVRLTTKKLPKMRVIQFIKYIEYMYRALLFAIRYMPEVIHCHDLNTLPIGFICSRKVIYDTHEFQRGRNGQTRLGGVLVGVIENVLVKRADSIITVNQEIASRLELLLGRNVYWILNADSKIKKNDHAGRVKVLREQLSISASCKIIVYPGKITKGRGLISLLRMAPYLRNSVVLLIGAGPLLSELRKMIEHEHLEKSVFLLPPVPYHEVSWYIKNCDLGVMPTENTSESYILGLGNKIFHYIAAGIPIAVSNQPAKKRIIETYKIGIIIDVSNPKAMAEEINSFFEDEERYRECKYNIAAAREQLNWENEEKKLLYIYNRLKSLDN